MRGSTHLFMSIMIYTPTFIFLLKLGSLSPDIEYLSILIAVGFGIAFGSLLPDLDAPTSKIMYGRWRYIGRLSRHIVTKPLSKLGSQSVHRGVLHSLLGLLYTSAIFAIVFLPLYKCFGIYIVSEYLDIFPAGRMRGFREDTLSHITVDIVRGDLNLIQIGLPLDDHGKGDHPDRVLFCDLWG